MAFTREPVRTPVEIGNIVIILEDAVEENGVALQTPLQSASFNVRIVLSDGTVITRKGNLVQHITPARRAALMNFMDGLRVQAEEQILSPPEPILP
jgi:hypothetical protein